MENFCWSEKVRENLFLVREIQGKPYFLSGKVNGNLFLDQGKPFFGQGKSGKTFIWVGKSQKKTLFFVRKSQGKPFLVGVRENLFFLFRMTYKSGKTYFSSGNLMENLLLVRKSQGKPGKTFFFPSGNVNGKLFLVGVRENLFLSQGKSMKTFFCS